MRGGFPDTCGTPFMNNPRQLRRDLSSERQSYNRWRAVDHKLVTVRHSSALTKASACV
jgi:hypothetical protein